MIKEILFLTIFANVVAFSIKQKNADQLRISEQSTNLQFANSTGSSITSAMVSFYIKTINEAYTYYRTDYSSNTNYIQTRLEGSYSGYFNVIIMTHNVTGGWSGYSTGGSSTVVWSGVNTAQPNWVYVINALPDKNDGIYVQNLSYGTGIDYSKNTVINNILIQGEGPGVCACVGLSTIKSNLQNFDGNKWQVLCKKWSSLTMFSRIRVSGLRYDFTSPNDCQYLVWTI